MNDYQNYRKAKDRHIATLLMIAGFILVPLMVLLDAAKFAARSAAYDMREEFRGGVKATYQYAHSEVMEALAMRRVRRELARTADFPRD